MKSLNMDPSVRVVLNTTEQDWEAAPAKGIWRKKLEREAAESGLTTSIVRYDPQSNFPAHSHPMGEEIFVLDGVFSDESGDFPAGSYLRNPPGSSHSPSSLNGCIIFVKLNQFSNEDSAQLKLDTSSMEWQPGLVEGLSVKPLHNFKYENVALVRWAPNTFFKPHIHFGGEEILVLDGVFADELGEYPAGTWIRSPHLSEHQPYSKQGCTILVKTGHLADRGFLKNRPA
ncbi:MAG: cupin domain-containing protein [Gammaproteobacteria bacterium]|nr:cupin domain-containing protein [Gammaproteobacteria bacterium]